MRLGSRSSNDFIQELNEKNTKIQNLYQEKVEKLTETVPVKVMMGDSTVTEQTTFDPMLLQDFYRKIITRLEEWSVQDISISNNEDLRRIFTKFEIREGNYLLSGHMSQQFHVLLYYKPVQRVIECQKELAEIIDSTKNQEQQIADQSDEFVLNKLKEIGYTDLEHQKLFEVLFDNDELREKIYKEINESTDVDFQKLATKKTELFNELDSLLVEIYQTTSVLIDDTRLVSGEEGCLCTFDLEYIKNNTKEGLFDPKKIPDPVKENIQKRLDEIYQFMKL